MLDEQVPDPVLGPLKHMLHGHQVDHVHTVRWKGKKDRFLLPDLAKRGYDVLVTADRSQLTDPEECKLVKRCRLHHVRFEQNGRGVAAIGSAIATIVAGLVAVVSDLERAEGQRLVLLKTVRCNRSQFEICDPSADPPLYWPGRQSVRPARAGAAPRQRRTSDELRRPGP